VTDYRKNIISLISIVMEDNNNETIEIKKPATKKTDKRSITSRLNLQKAREAKLQQLREQKELSKYPIYDNSDSSSDDSDYEEIVIRPSNSRNKRKGDNALAEEINELRNMVYQLSQSKKNKSKKKEAPRVVQIIKEKEVESSKKSSDPRMDELMKAFLGQK